MMFQSVWIIFILMYFLIYGESIRIIWLWLLIKHSGLFKQRKTVLLFYDIYYKFKNMRWRKEILSNLRPILYSPCFSSLTIRCSSCQFFIYIFFLYKYLYFLSIVLFLFTYFTFQFLKKIIFSVIWNQAKHWFNSSS